MSAAENTTLQIITEFKQRIQIARQEIQTNFLESFNQLKKEETRLLYKLNEIENEIIKDFELSSKTLVEITQAREQILATLKSNTTNALLKNTLEMYDKEIETIKKKSKIDSTTVQLEWNSNRFKIENICEISLVTNQKVEEQFIAPVPAYLKPLTAFVLPHFQSPESDNIQQLEFDDSFFDLNNTNINKLVSIFDRNDEDLSNLQVNPLDDQVIEPHFNKQSVTPQSELGDYMAQKDVGSQLWQCQYCTVLNPMQYSICEICERKPNF